MKSKCLNIEMIFIQNILIYIILCQWFFFNFLYKELSLFIISTLVLLIIFYLINYIIINNFTFYNIVSDENFTSSYRDFVNLIERNNRSIIMYYPINNVIFIHIQKMIKNLFLHISILSIKYNKIYMTNHLMFILNIILFNSFIFVVTFFVLILKWGDKFKIIFLGLVTIIYILYFFLIIEKISIRNIYQILNELRKYDNNVTIYVKNTIYSLSDFIELITNEINEETYKRFVEKILQLLVPFSYIIYLTYFNMF